MQSPRIACTGSLDDDLWHAVAARPAYELGSAAIAALPRRFHSASQHSQGPAWVLSLLAHPLQHSSCPCCSLADPPGPPIGRCHAAYAATQIPSRSNHSILGFGEDAHWWGTSPGRCAGVRARTLLVELLLGENTSHAIVSRGTIHDSLERSGPHVLLPHPPQITHIYPCIRSPSPSGSPSPLMGALCIAAGLARCRTIPNELAAQRLSASVLTSVPPPMYGDGETPKAHFSASDAPRW
ncbi:hypothetical protein B0H14DRAFT_3864545 [Mycena olivaceomarginata]|nr:hypothetical protein B0H14DRAFT_3864545 [Mycena olivaceomarginata]